MRVITRTLSISALLSVVAASFAVDATGFLTYIQNGSNFDYTIHLTNTGTTNLQTLWFAWIPGANFLPTTPTNIIDHSDWTHSVTHAGASDGYGIRFTGGTPLTVGSTALMQFTSSASPAEINAKSVLHPANNVGDSFIYDVAGANKMITLQAVPEPATLAVLGLGALLLRRRK